MALTTEQQQRQVAAKKARSEQNDDNDSPPSKEDVQAKYEEMYEGDDMVNTDAITAQKTAQAFGGDVKTEDGEVMSASDFAKRAPPKATKSDKQADQDFQAKGSQNDQKTTASPNMDPKHRPSQ